MSETRLTVSIVQYDTPTAVLTQTLQSLTDAVERAELTTETARISLIDNGGELTPTWLKEVTHWPLDFRQGHGNIGYGRGHNLALECPGEYHLILNPDVNVHADAIVNAMAFLDEHPSCGLITPKAHAPDGTRQRLARRYPTVLDMALRGFAPERLKERCRERLDHNDFVGELEEDTGWDIPLASGCFMFFRGDVLNELSGFDPGFFLYFEDSDLSLRCNRISRCAYVPTVQITHHGGGAASKGWRHIWLYGRSAARFFNKHGWKWA